MFLEGLDEFGQRLNYATGVHQPLVGTIQGVRHPNDNIPSIKEPLVSFEPWAASLRHLALVTKYEPLEGKLASLFYE